MTKIGWTRMNEIGPEEWQMTHVKGDRVIWLYEGPPLCIESDWIDMEVKWISDQIRAQLLGFIGEEDLGL